MASVSPSMLDWATMAGATQIAMAVVSVRICRAFVIVAFSGWDLVLAVGTRAEIPPTESGTLRRLDIGLLVGFGHSDQKAPNIAHLESS